MLILHNRGSLESTRYDRWLSGYDGEILLLCSRDELERADGRLPARGNGYHHVEAVPGYETSGIAESRVLELARTHNIKYLIACQERDIERAAQLREILGLPGQTAASALPFRNKILMKQAVESVGVPVARYRTIECATDLLAFIAVDGLPVVVKPQDGAGSFGVRILRTTADTENFLDNEFRYREDAQSNLMVEAFVSDTMCHVDGLVIDGEIVYAWPSQYLYSLAVFDNDTSGRLDVTLDAEDPVTAPLVEMVERVLSSLECPPSFPFHAEIFRQPGDRLVFGEIGCRTGGAAQRDVQRALFGIDPSEWWVRAQVGLPLPGAERPRRRLPGTLTGQLGLLKRPGRIRRLPGTPPFPWVESQSVFVRSGDVMRSPGFAGDFMALFVVSAPTAQTSVSRMRDLERWFLDELVLE